MIGLVERLARLIDDLFPGIGGREAKMSFDLRRKIEAFKAALEATATANSFLADTLSANADRLKKHDDDAATARAELTGELDTALKAAQSKASDADKTKTAVHDELAATMGKAGRRIMSLPDGSFEEYIPTGGGDFAVLKILSVDAEDPEPPAPVDTPSDALPPVDGEAPEPDPDLDPAPNPTPTEDTPATPATDPAESAASTFRPL